MASVKIFKPTVSTVTGSATDRDLTQKYVSTSDSVALDPISLLPIYVVGDELWEQRTVSPSGVTSFEYVNKRTEQVYPKALISFTDFMQPQTGVVYLNQYELPTLSTAGVGNSFGTLAQMAAAAGKTIPTTAGYCEVYVNQVNANDHIAQSINSTTEGVIKTTYVECFTKAEVDGLQILGVPEVAGSALSVTVKFWSANPKN